MSVDNYNVIRKHPDGGFFITTEFASDEDWPSTKEFLDELQPSESPVIYQTLDEAFEAASKEYSEYGTTTYGFDVSYEERKPEHGYRL